MINGFYESKIFGSGSAILEGALKNPNLFKEAVLFEKLNRMPDSLKKEFVVSEEAKIMIEKDIISTETLNRLVDGMYNNNILKITVCHMAKDIGDPMWDELVKCRIEERRIMNSIMDKFADRAEALADLADKETKLPEHFDQE